MAHQLITVGVSEGQTTIDAHHARISISAKDQVVWKTEQDEPFAVCFTDGGPFPSHIFVGTKSKPAQSDHASKGQPHTDYKYVVRVLGAEALDPVIHTDP